jgi:hypothetical protein
VTGTEGVPSDAIREPRGEDIGMSSKDFSAARPAVFATAVERAMSKSMQQL